MSQDKQNASRKSQRNFTCLLHCSC